MTQATVWHWLHKAKRIPAERVQAVATATGIPAHRMRPDVFSPPASAGAAA